MSIFTKFLNEETPQKFTQVKDGTYKAKLKDIALEEGLYTEYGKADKVHFSFGIINEEKEVVLLKASLFRSNMLNSLMGNISSDIGAIINCDPYDVTFKDVDNFLCNITVSVATSKAGNDYLKLEQIAPFTGNDNDKTLLSNFSNNITDNYKRHPDETLLTSLSEDKPLLNGKYFAIITGTAVCQKANSCYLKLSLMVEVDKNYIPITICLFRNNTSHRKIIKKFASFCESQTSDEIDLKGQRLVVYLSSEKKSGNVIFYNIDNFDFIEDDNETEVLYE